MAQATEYGLDSTTSINVVESGKYTESSPTLIFLHFWGGSSQTFAQTISHLAPKFHCLAIDFRGWGSSTGPQNPQAYSISQLATDIETLIPKLGVKDFILVGHSMGGKVSQLIAGRNLLSGLKGVVLLAPAPPTPFELPPDMKEQQISAYSTRESAEFVTRNVLSGSKLSDDQVSKIVEDMLKGNEFASKAWPAYAMAENIVTEVRRISVPVLVIGGELDRVEPLERLKKEVLVNINGAEMVVVQGSGHLLPVEAREEVGDYIENFVRKIIA